MFCSDVVAQIKPFMPNRLFYLNSLDRSISYMGIGVSLSLSCFEETFELSANSVYPDQTPRYVASDLGLHCLPMSNLCDAWLKWVKMIR